MVAAGIPFTACTMFLDDERSRVDVKIAEKLCDRYNVKHLILKPNKASAKDRDTFIQHSGSVGGDRTLDYVKQGLYNEMPDNAILLHGGMFEISRSFYEEMFTTIHTENLEVFMQDMKNGQLGNFSERELQAFEEWYNGQLCDVCRC